MLERESNQHLDAEIHMSIPQVLIVNSNIMQIFLDMP